MAAKEPTDFWRICIALNGGSIWLESTTEPHLAKNGSLVGLTLTSTSYRLLRIDWQQVAAIAIKPPQPEQPAEQGSAPVGRGNLVDVVVAGVKHATRVGENLKHTMGRNNAAKWIVKMGLNSGYEEDQIAAGVYAAIDEGRLLADQQIGPSRGRFTRRGLVATR